jgi:hypothetical protein
MAVDIPEIFVGEPIDVEDLHIDPTAEEPADAA